MINVPEQQPLTTTSVRQLPIERDSGQCGNELPDVSRRSFKLHFALNPLNIILNSKLEHEDSLKIFI